MEKIHAVEMGRWVQTACVAFGAALLSGLLKNLLFMTALVLECEGVEAGSER